MPPIRRITLEQIGWRLIHKYNVHPRRPDWGHVFSRHETHARDTQRDEDWSYDPPFGPPGANCEAAASRAIS